MGMSLEDDLVNQVSEQLAKQIDNEIMAEIGWQIMVESNPDWTLVELAWEKGKDTSYFWNEACAWAVENFGLPGENYMTHPTENNMKFLFKNEEDAILFALKWI
jgi:hypothetical protein